MTMRHRDGSPTSKSRRPRLWLAVGAVVAVVCVAVGVIYIVAAPLPGTTAAKAPSLGRGIIDYRLEQSTLDVGTIPTLVEEMGSAKLDATWTRVLVHWNALQPSAPGTGDADGYDDTYLAQLDAVISQLSAKGITVVLTPLDVPEWASDKDLWSSPPSVDYEKNTYYSFYAPDMDSATVGGAFKKLGAFLADRYEGKVRHFECWNEPNQGTYLYPQVPASATNGGGETYLKMLKQWHAGVKAGASNTVVIAGATSPRGRGDKTSTPPQAFAKYLKDNGALAYMDAYSHHPYTPGGSTRVEPGQKPNNPARCVTLGNLDTLIKVFPNKSFFLTEYGYNTQYCRYFGVTVSKADQARYLREAYAYTASQYPEVKALLWFLVQDMGMPDDTAGDGVYMGVTEYTGKRKPSWYAFAGGNSLTFEAPSQAESGASFTVSGKLTYRTQGSQSDVLTLQSRKPSGGSWSKVASVETETDGTFSHSMKQSTTTVYRIVWGGVIESAPRTVTTE